MSASHTQPKDFILWCLHCHHCMRFFAVPENEIATHKQEEKLVKVMCSECGATDNYLVTELVSIHF